MIKAAAPDWSRQWAREVKKQFRQGLGEKLRLAATRRRPSQFGVGSKFAAQPVPSPAPPCYSVQVTLSAKPVPSLQSPSPTPVSVIVSACGPICTTNQPTEQTSSDQPPVVGSTKWCPSLFSRQWSCCCSVPWLPAQAPHVPTPAQISNIHCSDDLLSCVFKDTVCPSGCSYSLISSAMNAAQDGDIIDLTATTYSTIGSAYILRSFTVRCASSCPARSMIHFLIAMVVHHAEPARLVPSSREVPVGGCAMPHSRWKAPSISPIRKVSNSGPFHISSTTTRRSVC